MRGSYVLSRQKQFIYYDWETFDAVMSDARPRYVRLVDKNPAFSAMVAIIDSIAASGLTDEFDYSWGGVSPSFWVSTHSEDTQRRARDEIEVRDPWWWGVPEDKVRISHEAFSGMTDTIERPIADAVPLFWRFVREKWGIVFPSDRLPA